MSEDGTNKSEIANKTADTTNPSAIIEGAAENAKLRKEFSIEIWRLIRNAQKQHGLRHGDYQRYRGYCTRRISRLRKALKIPQGDKRHYKKRDVTVAHVDGSAKANGPEGDERYLYIPLILAERSWAYAMQLRQESNTEPRKKFHLVAKLRKACTYALQLQDICTASTRLDAKTKLEAEAYIACMHGYLHFELGLWQTAAENFKKAQIIYENLIEAVSTTSSDEELIEIYRSKVDELTPSLRFCAYNISGDNSGDTSSMDQLLEMRRSQGGALMDMDSLISSQRKQMQEETGGEILEWRSRKIQVRMTEKVRLFLLSIQDLDKSIKQAKSSQAKIDIIESVLIDCKDTIQAVKDDFAKQDPKAKTGGGTSFPSNVQFLLAYLSYIRLIRTLERNLYLVAQAKQSLFVENSVGDIADQSAAGKKIVRPQNLTRLYEIIAQNIAELQQISGMESDDEYQKEINGLAVAFKAFRCYYIAITLVTLFKWKEAVALYHRATKYAEEAQKLAPTQFNLKAELSTLVKDIESCKFSAHAYSVLADDGVTTSAYSEGLLYGEGTGKSKQKALKSKPLYERLSYYMEDQQLNTKNPNVFKLTPDIEPIPCKPLFFDLALNFIDFPSLEDKIEPAANKANKQGISGFVKGFLNWGGNQ